MTTYCLGLYNYFISQEAGPGWGEVGGWNSIQYRLLLGLNGEKALHLSGEVLIDGLQVVQRLADLVHDGQELVLGAAGAGDGEGSAPVLGLL